MRAFIREWVDYVRCAAETGMSRDGAGATLTAMTDRYPMDVRQDGMAPMEMNLHDYATGSGIHRRCCGTSRAAGPR